MKRWQGLSLAVLGLGLAALILLGRSGIQPVYAAAPEVTQGTLKVLVQPGQKLLEFPLEHTDVKARISGLVAEVKVTQRFSNPYKDPIEAIYVFPLPQNAAVNDLVMKIGKRTIRGLIKKREEAKQIYEEAKRAGKTAALLEQERPNIFTQSVANIMPGNKILVTITYVQDLTYDDGTYDFVFPMVVGPRFIPGTPIGKQAGGWAPDTDQVPDASRITPPVLKPQERTGHDIALQVKLDAGVPIQGLRSKSHDVDIKRTGKRTAVVKLQEHDSIPNKDFVLQYDVVGPVPEMALLTTHSDIGGYFLFMIQPKAEYEVAEITPKEMVFVLDCSGSMRGRPIEKSKEVVRRFLKGMYPNDYFQIIRFSEAASPFAKTPLPNTPENVQRALAYIDGLKGSGGTRMIEGIKAALDYPHDPQRMRIVAFLTDGYIGNERQILAAIQEKLGPTRLFAFGVGSSVNRYLLDRMAEAGRGEVQYVRPDEETETAVGRFYDRVSRPFLTDIELDWGGLQVADIYPKRIPDLFSAQPVIIKGRYTKPGTGVLTVKGEIACQEWSTKLPVKLPGEDHGNEGLASLWARARIRDLMSQMYRKQDPEIVEQITDLALEFRLMSQYTSFVAVEEKVINEGGKVRTVQQPVPMPEYVDYEGVFGPLGDKAKRHTARAGLMLGAGMVPAERLQAAPQGPAGPAGMMGPGGGGFGAVRRRPSRYGMGAEAEDRMSVLEPLGSLRAAWLIVGALDQDAIRGELKSAERLLNEASRVIALRRAAAIGAAQLAQFAQLPKEASVKCLLLIGTGKVSFSEDDLKGLKAFVEHGGFVIVDSGSEAFVSSVLEALRKAAQVEVKELDAKAEIFRSDDLPYAIKGGCPSATGIYRQGKLIGFAYTADLAHAWSAARDDRTEQAYEIGTNLLSYALQN